MYSPPSSPKVYKKYRCRYFDLDGRREGKGCNQGHACRFVHPDDQNWPGLKPSVPPPRRPDAPLKTTRGRSPHRSSTSVKTESGSPDMRAEGRRALPPQSALFLRSTDPRDRSHDRRSPSDFRRNAAHEYNSTRGTRSRTPDRQPRKDRVQNSNLERHKIVVRSTSEDVPHEEQTAVTAAFSTTAKETIQSSAPTRLSPPNIPSQVVLPALRLEVMTALFKDLSKLYMNTTSDNVTFERDEKRLNSYTQISANLSRVSPKAAEALAPALINALQNRGESHQKSEAGMAAIEVAWEGICQTLQSEIEIIVAAQVGSVLGALPGDLSRVPKRPRADPEMDIMDESRAPKRLRMESREPQDSIASTDSLVTTMTERTISGDSASHERPNASSDIAAMLLSMQERINKQAADLTSLRRENEQLKEFK